MFSEKNKSQYTSFKLGYSRGLPSYLAPKLFNGKKQEEYFIASIFAQQLIYNDFKITGTKVAEDDSNKGPDVIISGEDRSISLQVTRFTLTNYLHRRNAARKRAERISAEVQLILKVTVPLNVTVYPVDSHKIPKDKIKNDTLLSKEIAKAIESSADKIKLGEPFINWPVVNPQLKLHVNMISLQPIPSGYYSNFFGQGNVFVNYEFDNVAFSESDIEIEAQNIYRKKEGGKADILLIWADKFDILYDSDRVAKQLIASFRKTSFHMVVFYCFFNRKDIFTDGPIATKIIYESPAIDDLIK